MEKRIIKIGNENKEVSLLGFGCMRFPLIDGEIDKEKSKEMMMYAINNGVNYIDTAYPYHGGKSELFVKEVIQDLKRDTFYLADKLPIWDCKTKEDVNRIFHEQLEKCGVEYFDFYLIHAVNKDRIKTVEELDLLSILEQYKKQGKIRNIGFSFHHDLEAFKLWVDLYNWDFCQIQLNYMDVNHQQGMEGYNILTKKGIPVIIMEPVKGGSLAKFNDDIESILKENRPEDSIASWAFRWIGSLENVKVVLSGMSTMDQVIDNVKTFSNFEKMNKEELKLIEKVKNEVNNLSKVECTSCNYCMPCPHGVDIPANFRLYNAHSMYQQDNHAKWVLGNLQKEDKDASNCINCGICVEKCPQHIDIPNRLSDFNRYLKENGLLSE